MAKSKKPAGSAAPAMPSPVAEFAALYAQILAAAEAYGEARQSMQDMAAAAREFGEQVAEAVEDAL